MTSFRTLVVSFLAVLSVFILLSFMSPAFAAGSHKQCAQCGMELNPQSRMVIAYTDGTIVDVCSIHCAADNLRQNKDKQVKSLMVADYYSKKLIDAKSAVWVIGGNKPGGMNATPKWAFSTAADAGKFVKENGGMIASFDEAMKSAGDEAAQGGGKGHDMSHMGHMHMNMEPGSQMLFNPAFSDHIYHVHPAGMWMVNFDMMHMDMRGLRDGTTNVGQSSVGFMRGKPYNYMMIPTSMTMDMQMLMLMYGVTDRLTVMAMANYQSSEMKMTMDMGPKMGTSSMSPMNTSGIGDTELRGMYKISNHFVGSLGLSLPTGDIEQSFEAMHATFRAPYDMQLGSGTYDLKPAITYNGVSDDGNWNWGGQAEYTWRTAKNENDWAFGDTLKVTSWIQRAFGPAATWLRLAYNDTGKIRGEDPQISLLNHPVTGMGAPMPDADPNNYGGRRLDGLIGVSFTKGGISFGVEGGIPLYQNLNGLQLKTRWVLNGGLQVMF